MERALLALHCDPNGPQKRFLGEIGTVMKQLHQRRLYVATCGHWVENPFVLQQLSGLAGSTGCDLWITAIPELFFADTRRPSYLNEVARLFSEDCRQTYDQLPVVPLSMTIRQTLSRDVDTLRFVHFDPNGCIEEIGKMNAVRSSFSQEIEVDEQLSPNSNAVLPGGAVCPIAALHSHVPIPMESPFSSSSPYASEGHPVVAVGSSPVCSPSSSSALSVSHAFHVQCDMGNSDVRCSDICSDVCSTVSSFESMEGLKVDEPLNEAMGDQNFGSGALIPGMERQIGNSNGGKIRKVRIHTRPSSAPYPSSLGGGAVSQSPEWTFVPDSVHISTQLQVRSLHSGMSA
jgi:hypothetical protein